MAGKHFTFPNRTWGYWGEDTAGKHHEDIGIKVNPANDVVVKGTKTRGISRETPTVPRRIFLWSLGRFYSKSIDEITEVQESDSGRITVSALGTKGRSFAGRWELVIEPDAGWMVREARFYKDDIPHRAGYEMKNSGTSWSGAHCIPKQAKLNYMEAVDGPREFFLYELDFEPGVEPFDEALFADAKQSRSRRPPAKHLVHRCGAQAGKERNQRSSRNCSAS